MINFYLPKRRPLIKEAIEVAQLPITPIVVLTLLTPLVLGSALGNYFVADDFTWLRWAGTAKVSDIPQFFLSAQGFFYRPLAKAYFLLVHPIFGLRPGGYHLVDFLLHFGCVLGGYLLALRLTKKKLVAFLASLIFLIHPVNAESVFWISSTSALFASFFYLWGFLCYLQWRASKKWWRYLFFLATLSAFILGLVSHERMITFPLVILFYDFVFKQYKKSEGWIRRMVVYLPFWFLTGFYLWLRNVVAQAHGLSGDYSYSLGNLIFNFVGNLFGYLGELIASFHFIPFYDLARSSLRSHKFIALGLLIVSILIILIIKKFSKRLKLTKPVVFCIGWFVILLLPFLGLGNIAERHVYPANFGFSLLMALFLAWVYERLTKHNFILGFCLVIVIIGGIIGFYQLEMEKAEQDWHQAGEIANKILLALSSNYIEFALNTNLYFVNVPIRLNRAWVFPVGLEDGIWFIYRDETLNIKKMTDLEEALDLAGKVLTDHVFIYEDGELKEARR